MESNNTFPEEIVKEIEARGAVPKPRWQFLLGRGMVWFLAIASVAIGSVAFSIAEFVFFDNDGIAKLEGSSIEDIAQSIPFIWLGFLIFFSIIAYYSFRRTRHGYRYATAWVVSVVIVLSIGLGVALNAIDFGQSVYQVLTGRASSQDGPN
ncbi:MAG: hypothetical protein P4L81_05395 [Candidatus Pacebacteria bacterium]|nr:hypothetical protein [Candidatus Paceibacterota bacterium]